MIVQTWQEGIISVTLKLRSRCYIYLISRDRNTTLQNTQTEFSHNFNQSVPRTPNNRFILWVVNCIFHICVETMHMYLAFTDGKLKNILLNIKNICTHTCTGGVCSRWPCCVRCCGSRLNDYWTRETLLHLEWPFAESLTAAYLGTPAHWHGALWRMRSLNLQEQKVY